MLKELKETNQRWVWDCAFSGDSQYIITGEKVKGKAQLLFKNNTWRASDEYMFWY